jgi:hypothetical protein
MTSRLRHWANELYEAFHDAGKPLAINPDPEILLKQCGFTEISHKTISVPYHPWPSNPHEKDMGRWMNLGMTQGLEALSMAPLTRFRHFTRDEVKSLVNEVKREICTRSLKSSCTM